MRTRVVENWQADTVDVYVFMPAIEGRSDTRMFRPDPEDGQRLKLVDVSLEQVESELTTGSYFSAPAPTYRIPRVVIDELIAQFLKQHPSANRDDAVQDARTTRDRLLSIVEGAMTSYTTAP